MEISIQSRNYPEGTIAIVRTASNIVMPIAKISDMILGIIASSKGRITQIIINPEYARHLASVGGAGALLVNRRVQELLRQVLATTYPKQSHPELADMNEW